MLPVVIPLRLFLCQFFCICMSLAIEASLLSKRAELPHQLAFHYSLVSNVVAVFAGWMGLFAFQGAIMQGIREQQLLSYMFSGEFIPEVPLASTQATCIIVAIALFVGGFLLKPNSLHIFQQFDLVPPLPKLEVGQDDPRLAALVQQRLRDRVDEAIRYGHVASILATILFFACSSASLWP